nr:PREDICTED: adenylate kinase 8 isoform X2 [Latimeria chalumnae]|eukprot:XP_014341646.1 PREDICTED: adenylate kinase 8 isoform X2 [Latimeria chalumnae]
MRCQVLKNRSQRTVKEKINPPDCEKKLISKLLVDRPEDPIQYLIDVLNQESDQVPQILVLGPPASGKKTIARLLCLQLRTTYITMEHLLQDEGSVLVKEACFYKKAKQEIPSALWAKLILERLSKVDCIKRGWLIEGFPETREQAVMLQQAGIIPEHVVILEAPDIVLIERNLGKKIDVLTGNVYHTTFSWPDDPDVLQRLVEADGISEEETMQRLLEYHRNKDGIMKSYQHVCKTINADQPQVDVFLQVLTYVKSQHRSPAPHTPRIVLYGPPGSGKSLQAALIAQKYSIVNVSCGQLLKEAVASGTKLGELVKTYVEMGQHVVDSLVVKVLSSRLSHFDCTTRGWVLHGFPRDVEQAEKLKDAGLIPNRVFFLDLPDDAVMERLTQTMTDPVTGERFHSTYKPPPNQEVQARLQRNPKDTEEKVQVRLDMYYQNMRDLEVFYQDVIHVNADQDPHTVFEYIESNVVNPLPKKLSEE